MFSRSLLAGGSLTVSVLMSYLRRPHVNGLVFILALLNFERALVLEANLRAIRGLPNGVATIKNILIGVDSLHELILLLELLFLKIVY